MKKLANQKYFFYIPNSLKANQKHISISQLASDRLTTPSENSKLTSRSEDVSVQHPSQ